jgi:hypothetical protein
VGRIDLGLSLTDHIGDIASAVPVLPEAATTLRPGNAPTPPATIDESFLEKLAEEVKKDLG